MTLEQTWLGHLADQLVTPDGGKRAFAEFPENPGRLVEQGSGAIFSRAQVDEMSALGVDVTILSVVYTENWRFAHVER